MHTRLIDYIFENHDIDIDRRRGYCYTSHEGKPAIDLTTESEESDMPRKPFVMEDMTFNFVSVTERRDGTFDYLYSITYDNSNYATTEFTGYRMYGAVCPEGNFYSCNYEGHIYLDEDLQTRGLIGDSPTLQKSIEWHGWLILTGAYGTDCEFDFKFEIDEYDFKAEKSVTLKTNMITQAQLDFIHRYKASLPIPEDDDEGGLSTSPSTMVFNFYWYNTKDFPTTVIENFEDEIFEMRKRKKEYL